MQQETGVYHDAVEDASDEESQELDDYESASPFNQ